MWKFRKGSKREMFSIQRMAGTAAAVLMMLVLVTPMSCAKQNAEKQEKGGEAVLSKAPKKKAAEKSADKKNEKKTNEAEKKEASAPRVLRLYEPAPELTLTAAPGGKKLSLKEYRGRTLVLAFWRPDSDINVEQLKILTDLVKKKKLDVAVIAVSPVEITDQGNKKINLKEKAVDTLKKQPMDVTLAFDNDNMETIAAYGVAGVPYYAIIDGKGRLQVAGMFMINQTVQTMTFGQMVEKVAGGGDVPPCELVQKGTPDRYKAMVGTAAPEFKGKDLSGEEQSTVFYKGFSRLLLAFWSPGCPHCRSELPRLEAFSREFAKKRNIFVLGVSGFPEEDDKIEEYRKVTNLLLDRLGVTFPNLPDYGGKISNDYKVQGVPSMFIVGKDGKIEEAFSGEMLFTVEALNCVLDRLDKKSGKGR